MRRRIKKRIVNISFWALVCMLLATEVVCVINTRRDNRTIGLLVRSLRSNKLQTLVSAINSSYVDSVNMDSLIDAMLPVFLENLDPHSAYYPAEETEASTSELHGSFFGVGVQFSIQEDTIRVNSVVRGGPAEKVGMLAGDKIVFINDSLYAGVGVTNNDVIKNLKGPKETEVKVGVMRSGESGVLDFLITRGEIPLKSVDAAYILQNNIGYIYINKFGETTYPEMMVALAELSSKGMKSLIIDLRDNTGGYLSAVLRMLNEFLPKDEMMVYTQGVHSPYNATHANGHGAYQELPLVVLINEASASASEIFSGAVQDNDRGTIIGRRSFGKGLVQEPIQFTDGSSIRLTVARYYTPSGRCIQKPYDAGGEAYSMELLERYERGEYFSADSIKLDETAVFKTKSGRTVYGGGGIMPDIFVPQDTLAPNEYYTTIMRRSLVNKFAFKYVDSHRATFAAMKGYEEVVSYLDAHNTFNDFTSYAAGEGVKRQKEDSAEILKQLKRVLYAGIVYDALDMQEYMRYVNQEDSTLKMAVKHLSE